MRRLLSSSVPRDGVFCYSDEVATGALRAIVEADLKVPQEIAIIGVGNMRFSDLLRVPLSSIDQNLRLIGERAARIALKIVESPGPRHQDRSWFQSGSSKGSQPHVEPVRCNRESRVVKCSPET